MLESSSLQKGSIEITRRGPVESYRVKPAPAGASSPTISHAAGGTEITRLIAASKGALAEFDEAESPAPPPESAPHALSWSASRVGSSSRRSAESCRPRWPRRCASPSA
jgi:hypothetical protein